MDTVSVEGGRWLAEEMRARRLTQRIVAKAIGVRHSTISEALKGYVSFVTCKGLAEYLDEPLDVMLARFGLTSPMPTKTELQKKIEHVVLGIPDERLQRLALESLKPYRDAKLDNSTKRK